MIRRLVFALLLSLAALPALAVNPDEILSDPKLEDRAKNLSLQLRCMVCQNQSIEDSNAELARDLRLLVRERITDGDSDEQVIAYVVSRYGEFVLLKPRLNVRTVFLWGTPIVLFAAGTLVLWINSRRRGRKPVGEKLTADEQARINRILGE